MKLKAKLGLAIAATLFGGAVAAAPVTQTFGVEYNYDDGPGVVSFDLTGLDTNITSDLVLDFTVIGDLSISREYFDLSIDGMSFGRGCDENAGNDSFGIAGDRCSQSSNVFQDASLTVDLLQATRLLSDGVLSLEFAFSDRVNDFVDVTTPVTRSGVLFDNAQNFAFGVGGTLSYDAAGISAVPLPAGLPLLLAGVGGFGLLRRRQTKG